MPVWVDGVYFGLHAKNLLNGGVLGRELFFLGPPGMVWIQAAIRSTLGTRPEAIRAVDLVIAVCVFFLLIHCLRPHLRASAKVWLLLTLCVFYLSTSEMCHCQPDFWMLLPTLGALELRRRQVAELTVPPYQVSRVASRGLLEGVLWGSAFLIKPQILVVAIVCYLISVVELARAPGPRPRRLCLDFISVALGGLTTLGSWLAWLWSTGGWPYFWTAYQSWGAEYYSTFRIANAQRALLCLVQLFPWGLINALAVPLALASILRWLLRRPNSNQPQHEFGAILLCACYLAFLYQAAFIQFGLSYHLVGSTLLGLTVLFGRPFVTSGRLWSRAVLAGIGIAFAVQSPIFRPDRLALWTSCWQGGSPKLYDRLALESSKLGAEVDYEALAQVADYLRKQGVHDGELTSYHNHLLRLCDDLGVRPSTRFPWIENMVFFFPSHSEAVREEIARSRQRFLVTDLRVAGLSGPQAESPGSSQLPVLPAEFPSDWLERYPWSEPIVFRAGRYLVHSVAGRPVGPLTARRP
jgi:hypothetical protein